MLHCIPLCYVKTLPNKELPHVTENTNAFLQSKKCWVLTTPAFAILLVLKWRSDSTKHAKIRKLTNIHKYTKKAINSDKAFLITEWKEGGETQYLYTSKGTRYDINVTQKCRSINSHLVTFINISAQCQCEGSNTGLNPTQRNSKTGYTHNSSMLFRPKNAPSMSLLIPLRCIFKDLRDSSPWNVRLSTILILFLFSSLI